MRTEQRPVSIRDEHREVVARFESEWRSGRRTPVQVFLNRHYPNLWDNREVVLRLIRAEWEARPAADPREFEDRFPDLKDLLPWIIGGRAETGVWAPNSTDESPPDDATLPAFPAGHVFDLRDRYTVLSPEPLGVGGFKVVLKARQQNGERTVALKVPKSPGAVRPTRDEGRVLAKLEHPNIPPVLAVGETETGGMIVAEKLIEGVSWGARLSEQQAEREHLPAGVDRETLWRSHLRRNLAILLDVCKALRYAHRQGIIHRDVKPQNVMLGENGEVYLVDWGLAVRVGPAAEPDVPPPHRSRAVASQGTLAYMAPEMLRGEANALDTPTDVFLLGSTLYEILTGRAPFERADRFEAILAVLAAAVPTMLRDGPDPVPPGLATIVQKATAFRPEDRYHDAEAFAGAVEDYLVHADAEDHLRQATRRHEELRSRLGEDRRRGVVLYPLVTPFIEVADQFRVVAGTLGARHTNAGDAGTEAEAIARERAARLDLVDLAEMSGDFNLAEAQLDRLDELPVDGTVDVAARRSRIRQLALSVRRRKWWLRGMSVAAVALLVLAGVAFEERSRAESERAAAVTRGQLEKQAEEAKTAAATAQGEQERLEKIAAKASENNARLEKVAAESRAEQERLAKIAAQAQATAAAAEATRLSRLKEEQERINSSMPFLNAAALGSNLRCEQVAAVNLAASLVEYDRPGTRVELFDKLQLALVPVKRSPLRELTGTLTYTPDGTRLITGDLNDRGWLRVWSVEDGRLLFTIPGHPIPDAPLGLSTVRRVVCHPADSGVVFSAGLDGGLRVSNLQTGTATARSTSPDGAQFLALDVDPTAIEGNTYRVATGDTGKRVIVWKWVRGGTEFEMVKELTGHGEAVTALRYAPKGDLIASGARDGSLKLWRADGTPAGDLTAGPGLKAVNDLAFSPDGAWLAVARGEPTIEIWNVVSRTKVRDLTGHGAGPFKRDWVLRLTFDPRTAATLFSTGDDGTIREWDAATGKAIGVRGRHAVEVQGAGLAIAVAVHPKRAELASSGADAAVRRWGAEADQVLAELAGAPRHQLGITCAAVCPATGRVVVGCIHGGALFHLYAADTLQPIRAFGPAQNPAFALNPDDPEKRIPIGIAFTPSGKRFYAALIDGTVLAIETDTGRLLQSIATGHNQNPLVAMATSPLERSVVVGITVSPDGRRLVTLGADFRVKVWETSGHTLVREFAAEVKLKVVPETEDRPAVERLMVQNSPVLEPDGRHLITLGEDGAIRRWDILTGRLTQTIRGQVGYTGKPMTGAFSPDGRLFASGSDSLVVVWDPKTWTPIRTVLLPAVGSQFRSLRPGDPTTAGTSQALRGLVGSLAFSRDRQLLVATQLDGTVNLIDLHSGTVLHRATGHPISPVPILDVLPCGFTPDGRLLTVSRVGEVFEWDLCPMPANLRVKGQDSPRSLTPNADGTEWAAPGSASVVRRPIGPDGFPAITDADFARTPLFIEHWPLGLRYSPDGRAVRQRDLPSVVAFVPNSDRLVIGNKFGTAVVVAGTDRKPVAVFQPPERTPLWLERRRKGERTLPVLEEISSVAVHPAGELVATNSAAAAVDVWRVKDGALIHSFPLDGIRAEVVAFRPRGANHLAVLDSRGHITVWDLDTKAVVFRTPVTPKRRPQPGLAGDADSAPGLDWADATPSPPTPGRIVYSPDGQVIAQTGGSREVWVYDANTGVVRDRLTGHRDVPVGELMMNTTSAAAFSPDSTLLATAGWDGQVRIWKRDEAGRYREDLVCSTLQVSAYANPFAGINALAPVEELLTDPLLDWIGDVLREATASGWHDLVRMLLGVGPLVPERDPYRGPPLHDTGEAMQRLDFVYFSADGKSVLTGGLARPMYRFNLAAAREWLNRPPAELQQDVVRMTGLRRAREGVVPDPRNQFVPVGK